MEIPISFGDVSTIILVFTAILIYFGKVISDVKVEKHNKTDIMIVGLFFTLLFIMLPLSLILFLFENNWVIQISPWLILTFQFIILWFLSRYSSFNTIKLLNQRKRFDFEFEKKIKEIKIKSEIIKNSIKEDSELSQYSFSLFEKMFKFISKPTVLLILSFCLLYSITTTLISFTILSFTSIFILSFINFSLIAVVRGISTSDYPLSTITLIDGKKIKGITLKYGEFFYIIRKDKKLFINQSQIKIIEQDIMPKKTPSK